MARHKKHLKAAAVRIIRQMIDAVLNAPDTIDQNSFPDNYNCKSAFCAAGHIVAAKSQRLYAQLCAKMELYGRDSVNWEAEAASILGLSDRDTDGIFGTVYDWPFKFRAAYTDPKGKTQKTRDKNRAKAFAARWESLIATDTHDLGDLDEEDNDFC